MTRVPPKVSVVVPVYNPGEHIRPLIDSLHRQSLAPGEFEAVFVDDGSTDDTPALLDRLAAEHAHFRVVHQPNSGWPGKPRNVGIEHATGDYVFFSDNDDWFGDEALERLHAMAVRNDADIVIGKMVGHDRGVPRELFRHTRDHATFDNAQLQDSLTPHKLFRRSFLNDHQLRFPEGKRRLEDHVFVMRAYFAARVISVLADYDCYHHIGRPDESNAGYSGIEPVSYYGYVRETVDIVLANTEPGVIRDRLLRRFLRVEVLGRLEGRRWTTLPDERQVALFDAARALVVDTMPESVDAGLPGRQRLVARLLRDGDLDAVTALAGWRIGASATVHDATWNDDDRLHIAWSATAGPAQLVERSGERWMLRVPRVDGVELDVTKDIGQARVDLIATERARGEVIVPTTMSVTVGPDGRLTAKGTSEVGFGMAAGSLDRGVWTLRLRVRALGWVADTPRLRWPAPQRPAASLVADTVSLVRPAGPRGGAMSLDVGGAATWLDNDFVVRASCRGGDGAQLRLPARAGSVKELALLVGDVPQSLLVHDEADGAAVALEAVEADGAIRLPLPGRKPLDLAVTVRSHEGRVAVHRPALTVARLRLARSKRGLSRRGAAALARAKRLARRARRVLR